MNDVKIKPLPKKSRAWSECNTDNCAICKEGTKDGKPPTHRLTCFGDYQCNHIFHEECIQKWLNINRSCPVCRSDGNTVGLIEQKDGTTKKMVLTQLEGTEIPWIHTFHAFFKLANLKVNNIHFIKKGNSFAIDMDICPKKNCKSRSCSHAISDSLEMIDWVRRCPDMYMRRKSPRDIAKRMLLPALMEFTPHIYEHLCEMAQKNEFEPLYQYTMVS